jgi:regulatory protein YycI of two-component signal transduction system YycFG
VDWSKTKTIFIIVFFILDIFLFVQFLDKRHASQLNMTKDASIEEKLKDNGIQYVELPSENTKGKYLTAKSKNFSDVNLEELPNQSITIQNGTTLLSIFDEPISVKENMEQEMIHTFLKTYVYQGGQYRFWKWDQEQNRLIFYQEYNQKLFFKNVNGRLIVNLNNQNQIIGYEQTLLEDIQELANENILPAIRAIETIHQQGLIKADSKITKVELGYYTLVQLTESQVLTPTWHFVIEQGDTKKVEDIFVNAIEGQVFQVSEKQGIME